MTDIFLDAINNAQFENDIIVRNNLLNGVVDDQMLTRLKRILELDHKHLYEGVSIQQLLIECKSNELLRTVVASWIAPDAKKQNKSEVILLEYLSKSLPNWKFRILAKSGKNSVSFQNGAVKLKSLDLYGECGDEHLYITHKYTNSVGGAQDGIKMELEVMIDSWNPNNGRLAIICDGNYWDHQKHASFFGKISEHVFVCRHDTLKHFI